MPPRLLAIPASCGLLFTVAGSGVLLSSATATTLCAKSLGAGLVELLPQVAGRTTRARKKFLPSL